jgi:PAS domain S-box-containing protein
MKKLIILLLGLILLFTFGICATVSADNAVIVKVGLYENKPKIFTDDTGNAAGFWPDIINYIASKEGWQIEYVPGTWTQCLERLEKNEIDLMPDVAYTPERDQLFEYSQETVYVSWSRVYARAGANIQSILDLEGKSVAVLKGSVNVEGPDGLKELAKAFGINCTFIEVDSYQNVFELVDKKEADAGVVSKDFAYSQENNFNVVETPIVFQPARLYFAFPTESTIKTYLIETIDSDVRELKANGDSIYYQSLNKWLGVQSIEKIEIPYWVKWTLIGIGVVVVLLGGGAYLLRSQVRKRTKELAEDIDKRKKTEKTLRESEEKYHSLFANMMNGFSYCKMLYDEDNQPVDFIYLEVNDAFEVLTGLRKADVVGKRVTEAIPSIKTLNPEIITTYGEVALTGKPTSFEVFFKPLDIWLAISVYSPHKDYFVTTFDNITKRKQAGEKLRESEEKLRLILETIPLGLAVSDMEGKILQVNRAAVRLSGFSEQELVGKTFLDFIGKEDKDIAEEYHNEVARSGANQFNEYKLVRKDGSEFPARLTGRPIKDETGNIIGTLAMIEDMSERQRAEEEHLKVIEYRELDRLRTSILSTVSHELRTPLAGIKGYTTLLLDYYTKLKKTQKWESLVAIDNSTDRLTELIGHLLDMSRLDSGLLKLYLQTINLREILITAMAEAKMRSPKYRFKTKIDSRLPSVMADAQRLRQVIDNLLDNAIKYSDEGTEITLRTEVRPKEILVSITDQGMGIPADAIPKIFDRFYRIEERLKKDPGGLGLGLSLCKALVEAHGGKIWVESKVDKGSTFYFTLPIKKKGKKEETQTKLM